MPPLAAALEECLEVLSILRGNQGRSIRDSSRILRAS